MIIDYDRVESTRQHAIEEYHKYIEEYDYITKDKVLSMPTMVAVGYFLEVHSKDPVASVKAYLNNNNVPYRKYNEIKTMVSLLTLK